MEHDLPPEIWGLVFDIVDTGALLAASTTSRFFYKASINTLLRHTVWRGAERARQHLSDFWTRFPQKGRHVRSLTLYCTPPLRGLADNNEVNADILKDITLFQHGLTRLTLSGVVLFEEFFGLLEALVHLRDLILRQCVVPPPPATLRSPPPLEHLSLVHLDAQLGLERVYCPYFMHLFRDTPKLAFDRIAVPDGILVHPGRASPTHLTLAGCYEYYETATYADILAHTDLSISPRKLTHLIVLNAVHNFPPYYDQHCIRVPLPYGVFDNLRSVSAPLKIIVALAAAGTRLTRVAVQGPLWRSSLVLWFIDQLVQHNQPVISLAIAVATWDDAILPYICARLPELETLEVLHIAGEITSSFLETLGEQIAALPRLTSLYLHHFTDGWYDCRPRQWEGHTIPTPPLTRPVEQSTINELSRLSSSLLLFRLYAETWVRTDAHTEWRLDGTEASAEWSSSRPLDEDMRYDYEPRMYARGW